MSLGGVEVLVLLALCVAIFGVGRLGEVGGSTGATKREFRRQVPARSAPADVPVLPSASRREILPREKV